MDELLERKLREMIDRQEIWAVLLRYARGLDRIDVELARSCYFDDAIEDHGAYVGDVNGFIAWANAVSLSFRSVKHCLLNHSCELDGDDAYAETYYQFTGHAEQPPHLLSLGRYVDHFQRRNGEWRIANRVTLVEQNFALNDEYPPEYAAPSAYGPDEQQPSTRDRTDASYQRPPRPRAPRPMPGG